MSDDIVFLLRERARIRRQIETRKSVREGRPDRIADLLERASDEIVTLRAERDAARATAERLTIEAANGAGG